MTSLEVIFIIISLVSIFLVNVILFFYTEEDDKPGSFIVNLIMLVIFLIAAALLPLRGSKHTLDCSYFHLNEINKTIVAYINESGEVKTILRDGKIEPKKVEIDKYNSLFKVIIYSEVKKWN